MCRSKRCRPMPVSISTTVPAAASCCVPRQGTVACSARTALFRVRQCRQRNHVVARRCNDGQLGLRDRQERLGSRHKAAADLVLAYPDLVVSAWIGGRYLVVVWPTLLTWMGAACLLNARRCHRLHCYLTGPYFLLLALTAMLYGLDVVPLGSHGWTYLSVALVVGGPFLVYVPERVFGRYHVSAVDRRL